jgi:hypothetical protein
MILLLFNRLEYFIYNDINNVILVLTSLLPVKTRMPTGCLRNNYRELERSAITIVNVVPGAVTNGKSMMNCNIFSALSQLL